MQRLASLPLILCALIAAQTIFGLFFRLLGRRTACLTAAIAGGMAGVASLPAAEGFPGQLALAASVLIPTALWIWITLEMAAAMRGNYLWAMLLHGASRLPGRLFGAVLPQRVQNKSHSRRMAVLLLSCCLGNPLALALVGLLNRLTGRIRTVFLLYPASKGYAQSYVYGWFAGRIRFNPALVGIYRQNGCYGLVFGISATERDFLSPANEGELRLLYTRMERLRRLTGARQAAFAGILPGLLASRGIMSASPEQGATVSAVRTAIATLQQKTGMAPDTPIIVLGAGGFVGRKLLATMAGYAGELVPIDLHNRQEFAAAVDRLRGKPTILLNVSTRGALREYAPLLWPEAVVLNEVYPEPGREELQLIANSGARCWHIAGVRGTAWPPFPRAYRAGIPCCASWLPEGDGEGVYEVVIEQKA